MKGRNIFLYSEDIRYGQSRGKFCLFCFVAHRERGVDNTPPASYDVRVGVECCLCFFFRCVCVCAREAHFIFQMIFSIYPVLASIVCTFCTFRFVFFRFACISV